MEALEIKIQKRKAIIEKIQRLLVENLNLPYEPDQIHPDTPLFNTGLALDSIDAVEIVVLVEQEFGCSIEESNISAMRNINTLTDLVLQHSLVNE